VIADVDGATLQQFRHGRSGPWNPLPEASSDIAEAASAGAANAGATREGGPTSTSTLLLVVALLALVAGADLIRRRVVHRS
jgi:hypothetical protein